MVGAAGRHLQLQPWAPGAADGNRERQRGGGSREKEAKLLAMAPPGHWGQRLRVHLQIL